MLFVEISPYNFDQKIVNKLGVCAPHQERERRERERQIKMTIAAIPSISGGSLTARGKAVLSAVPTNVVITPADHGSAFIGATSPSSSCRHVFTIGVLQGYRFVCLFKFNIWWMIPRMGRSGRDVPVETQLLLLEANEDAALDDGTVDFTTKNTFYILLLPVLDGEFRTSLQGTPINELQICVESGDPAVQSSQALEALFINSGDNPYELLKDSVKILAKHKGTFNHIESKKIPATLDWFGWCTWDAFYTEVSPQGIKEGLESLSVGGSPARFLLIDDGWQDTVVDIDGNCVTATDGLACATRLADIKENHKFKDTSSDLSEFIKTIKERYGLKSVYIWHALAGYWGGVLPTSAEMKKYNPKIVYPVESPGNLGNIRDGCMYDYEKYGIGLIDPSKIYEFYNDLHSYLASIGVDGVKVDVQVIIETLGSSLGGRVSLTRQYQQALEESIARNFNGNDLICCMCHNTDSIYSWKKSAVARASTDFMPRDPTLHTLHIATVAFNSLLLGEIVIPDWDMFQSKHVTAEFHGAARAIGGCRVYVSDKPGQHNFNVLKKIVLPDGSVLRARYAGRPTRDCLFDDPVMGGKSLMKIWNLNKLSGVVGVFNCQGVGSWQCKGRENEEIASESKSSPISGRVSPMDVEYINEVAGQNWTGDCAVYAVNAGSLSRLSKEGYVEVLLSVLQCEIYTVSPIRDYDQLVQFAPLGLIDMYNGGGAIEDMNCISDPSRCTIKMKGRGCGHFGAYSSIKPRSCTVDTQEEEFSYDAEDGFLKMKLPPLLQSETGFREISIVY